MAKVATRRDRYFLRDLHQEIDLYDRKIASLGNFVEFASTEERDLAEKGLRAKRSPLEKAALELAASGIEYDEKDLPRSFRAMSREDSSDNKGLTLVKPS